MFSHNDKTTVSCVVVITLDDKQMKLEVYLALLVIHHISVDLLLLILFEIQMFLTVFLSVLFQRQLKIWFGDINDPLNNIFLTVIVDVPLWCSLFVLVISVFFTVLHQPNRIFIMLFFACMMHLA